MGRPTAPNEEAVFLLAFVVVVLGITLYQTRKTERALEALRDLSSPRALVIRGGERCRIAGRAVVRQPVNLPPDTRPPVEDRVDRPSTIYCLPSTVCHRHPAGVETRRPVRAPRVSEARTPCSFRSAPRAGAAPIGWPRTTRRWTRRVL